MNLTDHFTLEELTHTDHRQFDNIPNEAELENLKRLAAFLEEVKTVLGGRPVMVNSGFRSKQVNDAVGSKDSSQHRLGVAVDIRVPGLKPDEVVKTIIASGLWTHISIPNEPSRAPRKQALIIDKAGTRAFA